MRNIYLLNGPNLNLLGRREPAIYGHETLADIERRCTEKAATLGVGLVFLQSNHEGVLIDWIHEAREQAAAIVINAGAFTHTSVAILDALKAFDGPIIELHLSNVHRRESFRHHSYLALAATGIIAGLGTKGYELALEAAVDQLAKSAG